MGVVAAVGGPVLAACSRSAADDAPDPLVPLAARARTDVALVTAAITADPALTPRLDPLRSARSDHAAALEEEIARTAGVTTTPAPAPTTAAPAAPVDLAAVRQAVDQAAQEASQLVTTISAERVGLVSAVSVCCATYSVVLAS
jgi:hypothetical protein